jgi:hypothetical protein
MAGNVQPVRVRALFAEMAAHYDTAILPARTSAQAVGRGGIAMPALHGNAEDAVKTPFEGRFNAAMSTIMAGIRAEDSTNGPDFWRFSAS